MWLILIQIYWKDLLASRKNGRRLAAAILSHHFNVRLVRHGGRGADASNAEGQVQNAPDKDILQPLASRLVSLLMTLLVSRPENFISPTTWSKYRTVLESPLLSGDAGVRAAFGSVKNRNEQLLANYIRLQPAARNIMVKQLDSTLQSPISDEFAADSWSISKDKAMLVKTLLEWCTSLYGPRAYVTVYMVVRAVCSHSN